MATRPAIANTSRQSAGLATLKKVSATFFNSLSRAARKNAEARMAAVH